VILEIQEMARRSVQGQITELTYVRKNRIDLRPVDYYRLCEDKTCWYTTITPCRTGLIIGSDKATEEELRDVTQFARYLGLAFQITDDTLNLTASEKRYGKEINGDILEGKRTLILIHLLNCCTSEERKRMRKILKTPRDAKTLDDVAYVRDLMAKYSSLNYSRKTAERFAIKARDILKECDWMIDKRWKKFFLDQTVYLVRRNK
jgi:geranylgeranyl diphosphate synthase type II